MKSHFSGTFLRLAAVLVPCALSFGTAAEEPAFDPGRWSVRSWNGETRLWEDLGPGKMTIVAGDDATRVTNTSGLHRHAHFVYPAVPEGDFTFTITLRGGYELGFLNRAGKDEMLYVELDPGKGAAGLGDFRTYELSRVGTRFAIKRSGRALPLVHFQFDYGEAFVITLAIRQGESAEIRSASLRPASVTAPTALP